MTNETGAEPGQPLTPREREVVELICGGLTNKEVAVRLQITHRTVEDHRLHAMKKYGARNVAQLVMSFYGIKQFGPDAGKVMEVVQ